MKYILIIFVVAVTYKLLTNFINLKKIQYYEKEFWAFLADEPNRIDECKMQTINLFKIAGIQDTQTPVSQPMGYGQVANFSASVFCNFPSAKTVIADPALLMFKNATGVFKSRMLEAINPLYWIDLLLFLPKNILRYIGLSDETLAFKLWNVFLTFIWWCVCTSVTIFQPEIKSFIIKLFTQFQDKI